MAITPVSEKQRDGTFSDVLENAGHEDHPSVDFEYPQDFFPEEELHQELKRAVKVLAVCGVTRDQQVAQLQRVFDLLERVLQGNRTNGADGTNGAAARHEIELSTLLAWIWRAGTDGLAQASAEAALMRFGVVSWYLQPALFGDANQREFGVLLREQASVRCPNCAKRKRELEHVLRSPSPAFRLRPWRGFWVDEGLLRAELRAIDTHYVTTEMKKQSPNRIVTEFRDEFEVRNGHMRTEEAREQFRECAKSRGAAGLNTRSVAVISQPQEET